MKITKAVIPAAGLGTRVLPATKAIPKEMLTIVDKPSIQYIVEEAVAAGITDILIITNRGKVALEDHFDRSPELEERLLAANKTALYNSTVEPAKMANIYFLRQKETKGLGHAVNCAKGFVGNDPFAVLYGDDVILGGKGPAIGELCQAYEKYGKGVVGIKEVTREAVKKYCSLAVEKLEERTYAVSDMIEKPTEEQIISLFAILGRCVLTPDVFALLDKIQPGAGGEIQLTDAMRIMAQNGGMIGYEFTGKRYDIGNKLGYLEAVVEVGIKHPELGEDFKKYLKNFVSSL